MAFSWIFFFFKKDLNCKEHKNLSTAHCLHTILKFQITKQGHFNSTSYPTINSTMNNLQSSLFSLKMLLPSVLQHCFSVGSGQLTQVPPTECVRLPWPSLSVTEDGGIAAVDPGLHQRLDAALVHLILAGCRSKHVVEGEQPIRSEHHLCDARNHPHAHLVVV